ncbi:MAG: NADH:flavin oxidoreductase [Crocinitomicaceae bacterium]|nr:NADH:flavin oxidoreductase [Crocinitomicaceae bacterium]
MSELSNSLQKLLSPVQLNGITLKNRIIKAATFESMLDDNNNITDKCIDFHESFAAGGVGMTTLAYCAPEPDGRMIDSYMYIREEIKPQLQKLAERVHKHGCMLSGQIAHCGAFSRNKKLQRKRPVAPSTQFNSVGMLYGLFFTQEMDRQLMDEVANSYGNTAKIMKESGFDAVELHFGHGYLLSQFISPITNKRKDNYGGCIENRMRYPLEVLANVRKQVGDDFPILAKITMYDDMKGGISLADGIESAKLLDKAGIDGIILSAGTSSQNPMLLFHGDSILPGLLEYEKNPVMRFGMKLVAKTMFRNYPYRELYLLEAAKKIKAETSCHIIYIGGANEVESLEKVMDLGFDFVQSGRPLLRDPEMIHHLQKLGKNYVNGCDHCNKCAPLMNDPDGIRCVLPKWSEQ